MASNGEELTFGTITGVLTKINLKVDSSYKEIARMYGLTEESTAHCCSVIKRD
jgi:hypothetical protein